MTDPRSASDPRVTLTATAAALTRGYVLSPLRGLCRLRPGWLHTLALMVAILLSGTDRCRSQDDDDSVEAKVRSLTATALAELHDLDPDAINTLGKIADLLPAVPVTADCGLPPVAGAWHRELYQLSAGELFDELHTWSMPTDGRRHVRSMTSLVPRDAPPKELARGIGERPRSGSFPIAEINGVRGLFSTDWLLVQAAQKTGRLNTLIEELNNLQESNTAGAGRLLLHARIVAAADTDETLRGDLQTRLAVLRGNASPAPAVWQYGYIDNNDSESQFRHYPAWTGSQWQGAVNYPDNPRGWSRLDAAGGQTSQRWSPVRRWTAPADGRVRIENTASHPYARGDGVSFRIDSSRSGRMGSFSVFNGERVLNIPDFEVRAGDTIDFIAHRQVHEAYDRFEWRAKLVLERPDAATLSFDSTTASMAPRLQTVLSDVVLAAACLNHKSLQPYGEQIVSALDELGLGSGSPVIPPMLREAHAVAVTWREQDPQPGMLVGNQLKLWLVASGNDATRHAAGGGNGAWVTHEDHVMHLGGPRSSALLFRYPLTGKFEFSVEAQQGGGHPTDGCLAYSGLQILANQTLTVHDVDSGRFQTAPAPFLRRPLSNVSTNATEFNRLSIRVENGAWTFLLNGHPVWRDTSQSSTSPWLGLRAFGDRSPVFRNLELIGAPQIPREVRLIGEQSMRGWQSTFFKERQPPFTSEPNGNPTEPFVVTPDIDWFVVDGTLIAEKVDIPNPTSLQSLLRYHRPLQNGDTLRYEFKYSPGETVVHPAIGRHAFVLNASGVRLHWITDGEHEWTGLDADNAIIEPAFRRAAPTLRTDDWNQMQVALVDGVARLTLNDEVIYERPLQSGAGTQFSLFRNPLESGVRVRNAVLTGDWPESLPADIQASLTEPAREDRSKSERHALNAAIGESVLAADVFGLLGRAESLSDVDRLELLSRWVLPKVNHPELRVTGAFRPYSTSPKDQKEDGVGQLVSPVYELIAVAKHLNRLDELREIFTWYHPSDDDQRRARLAMIFLIETARGNLDTAEEACSDLLLLTDELGRLNYEKLWPETLVIFRGMSQPETQPLVEELFLLLSDKVTQWNYSGSAAWDNHFMSLRGHTFGPTVSTGEGLARAPFEAQNWQGASVITAKTHAAGYPMSEWRRVGNRVEKVSVHDLDLLHYRLPLTGNFDIEFDATVSRGNTGVMFAGVNYGMHNASRVNRGTARSSVQISIDPPLSKWGYKGHWHVRVRDGVCQTILNGNELETRPLPADVAPWLAVFSRGRHLSAVSNLEITGDPVVPESVNLASDEELTGWVPYYGMTVGPASAGHYWSSFDDPVARGISSRFQPDLRGSYIERLLQYYRPLFKGDVIEYEFQHIPERVMVHPAIGRLAFVLTSDGVVEHKVTDSPFNRIAAEPGNRTVREEFRRGPSRLLFDGAPLNRMQVQFDGRSIQLVLNDELIYERPLDAGVHPTFGLFHWADQSAVRVRNVVMRGDWPTSLPPRGEQELALNSVAHLDKDLADMVSFEHDFGTDEIDEKHFKVTPVAAAVVNQRSNGVHIDFDNRGQWGGIGFQPLFEMHGDYDIEVAFDEYVSDKPGAGGIAIVAKTVGDKPELTEIIRYKTRQGHHVLNATRSIFENDLRQGTPTETAECETASGRLRLARRGTTLWYLFAHQDSESWQVVSKREGVTTDPVNLNGAKSIRAGATRDARVNVLFKSVTIRADKLMLLDESRIRGVAVMNADGTGFREVAWLPEGMKNLGSPEWSPDGKSIAFDAAVDGTPTAHVYTVDLETKKVTDCGDGCMPSYTGDGRRMVFTFPGYGVGSMDLMGGNRELIERYGWSGMVSPNGKYICWGYGSNIQVYNIETKERADLLVGDQARMFNYMHWNPGWSHDSRWICFKGRNRETGEEDIAVAAIDTDEFKVILPSSQGVSVDFTWHPDNKRVLLPIRMPGMTQSKLYFIDRTNDDPPQLLPGQPDNWNINHGDWSPDGKMIAVSGNKPPQTVEWPIKQAD